MRKMVPPELTPRACARRFRLPSAQRDAMGRLWQTKETSYGGEAASTRALVYSYDGLGQLTRVTENGVITEQYSYDPNGNRLTELGSETAATHDAQDRLLTYAQGDGTTWAFTYTDDGSLSTAAATVDGETKTTHYVYDESGNLTQVTLNDGTVIGYIVDGRGRRIGKKVNGALTKQWLYDGQLRIVAELSGTTLTRFVYRARSNTLEMMLRYTGGSSTPTAAYRIFSDHLGSPRYVVNVTDGSVLFAASYSAYGVRTVTTGDSDAIPFGFAGGPYDAQTGLTRFGARDYDARFGRWTSKDPILFDGGQTNLYVYVGNDPVNRTDPTGEGPFGTAWGLFKKINPWRNAFTIAKTLCDALIPTAEEMEEKNRLEEQCARGGIPLALCSRTTSGEILECVGCDPSVQSCPPGCQE